MDTGNPNQVLETQSTAPTGGEPKTFTQEDVNHIVAKRVAKYADYEELKEKAAKYDEQIEANKSTESYKEEVEIEAVLFLLWLNIIMH